MAYGRQTPTIEYESGSKPAKWQRIRPRSDRHCPRCTNAGSYDVKLEDDPFGDVNVRECAACGTLFHDDPAFD